MTIQLLIESLGHNPAPRRCSAAPMQHCLNTILTGDRVDRWHRWLKWWLTGIQKSVSYTPREAGVGALQIAALYIVAAGPGHGEMNTRVLLPVLLLECRSFANADLL